MARFVLCVAVLAVLVVTSCAAPPPPARPRARAPSGDRADRHEAPPPPDLDEEERRAQEDKCASLIGHSDLCRADPECLVGKPINSCWGSVCTQGGPENCMACLDWIRIRGLPRELCILRAAGLHLRDACEMMYPRNPERCAPRE